MLLVAAGWVALPTGVQAQVPSPYLTPSPLPWPTSGTTGSIAENSFLIYSLPAFAGRFRLTLTTNTSLLARACPDTAWPGVDCRASMVSAWASSGFSNSGSMIVLTRDRPYNGTLIIYNTEAAGGAWFSLSHSTASPPGISHQPQPSLSLTAPLTGSNKFDINSQFARCARIVVQPEQVVKLTARCNTGSVTMVPAQFDCSLSGDFMSGSKQFMFANPVNNVSAYIAGWMEPTEYFLSMWFSDADAYSPASCFVWAEMQPSAASPSPVSLPNPMGSAPDVSLASGQQTLTIGNASASYSFFTLTVSAGPDPSQLFISSGIRRIDFSCGLSGFPSSVTSPIPNSVMVFQNPYENVLFTYTLAPSATSRTYYCSSAYSVSHSGTGTTFTISMQLLDSFALSAPGAPLPSDGAFYTVNMAPMSQYYLSTPVTPPNVVTYSFYASTISDLPGTMMQVQVGRGNVPSYAKNLFTPLDSFALSFNTPTVYICSSTTGAAESCLMRVLSNVAITATINVSAVAALPSATPSATVTPSQSALPSIRPAATSGSDVIYMSQNAPRWMYFTYPAGSSATIVLSVTTGCLDFKLSLNTTIDCHDAQTCAWDYSNEFLSGTWSVQFPGAPFAQPKGYFMYVAMTPQCSSTDGLYLTYTLPVAGASASPTSSVGTSASPSRTPTTSASTSTSASSVPTLRTTQGVSATPSPSVIASGVEYAQLNQNTAAVEEAWAQDTGALFRFTQPADVDTRFNLRATRGSVTAYLGRNGFPTVNCATATDAADCNFLPELSVVSASVTSTTGTLRRLSAHFLPPTLPARNVRDVERHLDTIPTAVESVTLPRVATAITWYVLVVKNATAGEAVFSMEVRTGGDSNAAANGLPSGTKVAIGVAVPILVLAGIVAAALYVCSRKRTHQPDHASLAFTAAAQDLKRAASEPARNPEAIVFMTNPANMSGKTGGVARVNLPPREHA